MDEASDVADSIEVIIMATRREMLTRLEHGKPVRRVAGHMQARSVRRPGSLLVVDDSDHQQSATPGPRWAEALTTQRRLPGHSKYGRPGPLKHQHRTCNRPKYY